MYKLILMSMDKAIYEGEVQSMNVPGSLGYFEVLLNHAAIMTALQPGKLEITLPSGAQQVYAISGGILDMNQNIAVILGDAIERAEEIDLAKAQKAYQRAASHLEISDEVSNRYRASKALLRAKNRIEVADSISPTDHQKRMKNF